jgi:hypothetical protein
MANLDPFEIPLGDEDYVAKWQALLDYLLNFLNEIEAARNGSPNVDTRLDAMAAAIALLAPLSSPTFTNTPTAPTPSPGDNSTRLATTAFVVAAVLSATLPGMSGNARRGILTDGTSSFWGNVWGGTAIVASSSQTAQVRQRYLLDSLSAAFTVTLPASPADGDWIAFTDIRGQCGVNNVTIGRNGNNLVGLAEDLVVNQAFTSLILEFKTSYGWVIAL